MSTLKIGFHAGPGGNHTGIGNYYRTLDEAGIPFIIKSVDHYGHIFEACQYENAPHVRVFRISNQHGGTDPYEYDTPPYGLSPVDASLIHWNKTIAKLPPEFDKTKVWLEVVNEVDKNRAEWMAEFAYEISLRALAAGYKIALFSWSGGEPEPEHWRGPKMLEFLRLCAIYPDKIAIALHEYSFTIEDIHDGYPYKVGRYKFLHDACDENNIPRPTILITEWGWTLNNIPGMDQALSDINMVAIEYATHANILGAAIWYLGTWNDGLADKVQKLILPVTEMALSVDYPEPIDPPEGDGDMTTIKRTRNQGGFLTHLAGTNKKLLVYEGYFETIDGQLTFVRLGTQSLIIGDNTRALQFVVTLDEEIEVNCDEAEPPPPPAITITDLSGTLPKHATLKYEKRANEDEITVIAIHHTVSGSSLADITTIANYHVNTRGWPGIAYHYCIAADGKVYQTNELVTKSFHSGGNNHYSIGIALLGDFTNQIPTAVQLISAQKLVDYLVGSRLKAVNHIWGHRDMPTEPNAGTACPGATYLQWIGPIANRDLPLPSTKFKANDIVTVTSNSALNLRSTPFGSVLASYPTGKELRIIHGYPVRAGGFVWWAADVDGVSGWIAEDYIALKGVAQPPPGTAYNMTSCYLPTASATHSDIVIKKNNWGEGDERTQIILQDGYSYVTKSGNYERYRITNTAIFYEVDTSRNNTEMIEVTSAQGWIPAQMSIGQTHTAVEDVTIRNKDNCSVVTQYSGTFSRKLVNVHGSYTIPESGFVYQNVRELWWVDSAGNPIEKHWFAPGIGRIRWSNNEGRVSWVHEHIKLGDQGNNSVIKNCS